jgi:NAD-dependent SIR2 family protein deacetylase
MKGKISPIFRLLIEKKLINLGERLHFEFKFEGNEHWYKGEGIVRDNGIEVKNEVLTPSMSLLKCLREQEAVNQSLPSINGWLVWRNKNGITLSELGTKIDNIGISIPSPVSPILKKYYGSKEKSDALVSIFGAGASYGMGIPTQSEILEKIINCTDKKIIETIPYQEFTSFYRKFFSGMNVVGHTTPFENIFGFLDYFIINNKSLRGKYNAHYLGVIKVYLERLILSIINVKVDEFSKGMPLENPYFKYVRTQLADNIQPVLVTLNYDTLLSSCFTCFYPFNIYLNYGLELANYKYSDEFDLSYNWINPNDVIIAPVNIPPQRITVIKMHGSTNWKYCDNCESIYVSPWKNILHINLRSLHSDEEYENNIMRFPDLFCHECQNRLQTLITPPTQLKEFNNPVIRKLHYLFQKHIKESKGLVSIGYSFPAADIHIKSLLSTRSHLFRHVHVVNPTVSEHSRAIHKIISENYTEWNLTFNDFLSHKDAIEKVLKKH